MKKHYKTFMWLSYIVLAIFYFYESNLRAATSVIVPTLVEIFGKKSIGLLYTLSSLYFYIYALLQFSFGFFLDRFGLRGILTFVAMISGIGGIVFAFSSDIELVQLGRFLFGFGSAFVLVGFIYACLIFFPKNRWAFSIGFGSFIGMLGAFLGGGPLRLIINRFGLHSSLLVFAAIGFFIALSLYLVLQSSETEKKMQETNAVKSLRFWRSFLQVTKHGKSWCIALASFCYYATIFGLSGPSGISFLQKANHFSENEALFATSMLFLGFGVGGPIIGLLSDKMQRRKDPLSLFIFLSFCTLVAFIYLSPLATIYVYLILFLLGFFSSAQLLTYLYILESVPSHVKATAISFVNGIVFLGCAFLQTMIGHFLNIFWGKLGAEVSMIEKNSDDLLALVVFPILLAFAFFFIWMTEEEKEDIKMSKDLRKNMMSRAKTVAKFRKIKN